MRDENDRVSKDHCRPHESHDFVVACAWLIAASNPVCDGARPLGVGRWGAERVSERIARMCTVVGTLARELDLLTAGGHARTVYAVMVRMRLAAMTADLVTADLVERLQASEDVN